MGKREKGHDDNRMRLKRRDRKKRQYLLYLAVITTGQKQNWQSRQLSTLSRLAGEIMVLKNGRGGEKGSPNSYQLTFKVMTGVGGSRQGTTEKRGKNGSKNHLITLTHRKSAIKTTRRLLLRTGKK